MRTATPVEIGRLTLSPSALSAYEICGRRGSYYQDKTLPRKSNLALVIGGAWHQGLETYFQARIQSGDKFVSLIPKPELEQRLEAIMVGALQEGINQPDFSWQDGESMGEAVADLHQMLASWMADPSHQWMGDPGIAPMVVEKELLADFGSPSHVLPGYVDLVLQTQLGPIGVDHKTAGRAWGGPKALGDPRKLIQAPLYAEAWTQATGEEMNHFAYDVMTRAGRFQRVWVDTNARARAPFIQRWREIAEQITLFTEADKLMPTNPGSLLCSEKWCDFWEICEMGAPLDIEMQSGTHVPDQNETR